ncbi:hypothetical protein HF086_002793 [Spodoptera exigua]|uniref:Exonuclease domain-containing protein n=1 Tax=Spodoptera exigua TaxID=7107 RepID=A0A922MP11_SPOEX|nr:hypothetical protein HF086_002793 [Spodoptera exigua]
MIWLFCFSPTLKEILEIHPDINHLESTPSLKRLAKEILGIDIQSGEHSSVEDARAAMQLYCSVARQWEPTLADKRGKKKVNPDDD